MACTPFISSRLNVGSRSKLRIFVKKMSSLSFVQNLNPISNKMEWKVVEDDYDYNQEIATSCYGDMLHDDERNKKFGKALEIAIQKFHSAGKQARVLDIGTGTGLLSMLAVRYGADCVTACEAFLPMANCAVKIINENNLSDKIKIIKCHSTSLTVGEKGDLRQRANILVSEVFDTELIGEGAIKTFNHAFENLLTEDCIVIPSSGIVYAQVVESKLAQKWNRLEDWELDEKLFLKIPKEIKTCIGTGAVHDIQLSEFNQKDFKALSDPIPIFRFDWAKNKKISTCRQTKSLIKAISSGKAQVVFMWWDLIMDQEGDVVISCSPVWEHPSTKGKNLEIKTLTKSLPWRDHWMQAVYFLNSGIKLEKNECFSLVSNHDEFSFWFQVQNSSIHESEILRPVCQCCFHFLLSRARIGGMNDEMRRICYLKTMERVLTKETVCIILGDISLLAPLSANLGAKKVYAVSEIPSVEKVYKMLLAENNLADVLSVRSNILQVVKRLDQELVNESFDVLIVSEPYFRHSILPWDNLAFWYAKEELINSIKHMNQVKSIKTLPTKGRLRGCAVQFDNLWRIARPLNTCEGFSMKIFDNLIAEAKEKVENYVEPQSLWEYPGIALSLPLTFFEFDFNDDIPKEKIKKQGEIQLQFAGRCDGVALWMEYNLSKDYSLSFGPTETVVAGQYITWDLYEKQGVHLFRTPSNVNVGNLMFYDSEFDPHEAEINFHFHFEALEKP